MNLKTLLISLLLIVILVCCGENSINKGQPANLINPSVLVYTPQEAVLKSDLRLSTRPTVELPLLIWPSFESRKISISGGWSQGSNKKEFCVINEIDGIPIKIETSIKFLNDATCFYIYYTSKDGVPHKYVMGLVKIKILDTGEEVWTWRKAVEILD